MIAISKTDPTIMVEVKKMTGEYTFEGTFVSEYNPSWKVGQTCDYLSIDSFHVIHDLRDFLKMRDLIKETLGI
jgi:hypothetical protein